MTNSSRSSMDSDNAEHPHGRNPANRTPAEAMRHNPCFGIMGLMPNRHKIHAVGHSSRLNREGITQQAKFASERYSKEEMIAELGAAFLSNEVGIRIVSGSRTPPPISLRGLPSLKMIPG